MDVSILISFCFSTVFGLLIGSFLNVVIDRYEHISSILYDRSRCDHCKKVLRWYELIPVLSFLLLKGTCARCKKKLSIQYPTVELITGVVFGVLGSLLIAHPVLLFLSFVIASSLIVITVSDLKYFIIPDIALGIGIVSSFLYILMTDYTQLPYRIVTGVLSFLFLYSIHFITRGKGMGFGDVKFAFFLGLSLGFPGIIISFYLAFLTGALVGVILILRRKKSLKTRIPFGPFLILGYVGTILFYEQIYAWISLYI